MRQLSPFAPINRYIARMQYRKPEPNPNCSPVVAADLNLSLLGYLGTGEAKFLQSWVEWADADRTTYG